MPNTNSTAAIIAAIRGIPPGKVASYAQVARLAGLPNGARQVARVLHSCSGKYDLPWWRVLRSSGEIALPDEAGGIEQRELLLGEGVIFRSARVADLHRSGLLPPQQ